MSNQKGIDFLKNRIRARLMEVSDQMGKYRFKLYMAMVDECDDFEELKEMAELDLQMDFFDYVRTEINPMLDELNMSIADVRRMDSGEIPKLENPLQNYEIEPSEIEELMDDSEANAAMAMLIMNRIKNEPDEERYRQEILDFQLEERPDIDSIDSIDISDEDDGLAELLEDDIDSSEYSDESSDSDESDDSDDSDDSDEEDLSELDGFFDDMPDDAEVEEGQMSEDEIFVDIDEDDLEFIGEDSDDSEESDKMTEDEIFSDIDEDELSNFMVDANESDDSGENESDDSGDIDEDPFSEISTDDLGDYDFGDESSDIDDIDDDDFEGIENIEGDDDFLDDSDDVEESSDPDDIFSDIDEDELGLDDELEDEPEDEDPFSDIDESELDGFTDDDESEGDSDEDDDPFSDIDIDDIGVLDDSDDFFSTNKPVNAETVPTPNNALVHTPNKPARANGIKPTTVFSDGTERGNSTQEMFNMFNSIGIGSAKAAQKIKNQTIKVANSKFLSMGFEDDDSEIDF